LKKLIAIWLLTIHLFNIGGQLAFHEYMVYKSDRFFDAQVNKNLYNKDDLTEIKIPVDMPAVADWKNYVNISGTVQFRESSYNYVKMKITRHAVFLMCVPNYATTHYSTENVICAKEIKDIPVPKKDHVPYGKINLATYSYQTISYSFTGPVLVMPKIVYSNYSIVTEAFITGPGQPPDTNPSLS
jgi:hypothetical protein